jgi:hypothetical protein
MKYTVKKLKDVHQTGAEMVRLVKTYHEDVAPFDNLTLSEYYSLIKKIPYRLDPQTMEYVQRPKYSIGSWQLNTPCDCDDKAICIGAWLYRKGIPFQFLAVSLRADKKLHHATLRAKINGEWKIIDATYPKNVLFKTKPITKAVKISQEITK